MNVKGSSAPSPQRSSEAKSSAPAAAPAKPAESKPAAKPAEAAKPATTLAAPAKDAYKAPAANSFAASNTAAKTSAPAAPAAAPAASTGPQRAITMDYLNVRSSPNVPTSGDPNANKVGMFPPGLTVTMKPDANGKSEAGSWVHVEGQVPGGQPVQGWVSKDFLAPQPAPVNNVPPPASSPSTQAKTSYAAVDLNVRGGPGTENGVLTRLPAGTKLEVQPGTPVATADGNNWVQVKAQIPGGQTVNGWASSNYMQDQPPAAPPVSTGPVTPPPSPANDTLRTPNGVNVRSGPGTSENKLGTFGAGAILKPTPDATGQTRQGDWVHVEGKLPDGKSVQGWVNNQYVNSIGGVAQGPVGPKAQAAMDWAAAQTNPETATGVNHNTGISAKQDSTAWNGWCLAFAANAYGLKVPEMQAASAIASYEQFKGAGKLSESRTIPPGAPVYFEATKANGDYGHVAIATGKTDANGEPTVYTSGWDNYNGIHEVPISYLEKMSGGYLGYGMVS